MAQLLENRNVEACNGIWAVKLFGEKSRSAFRNKLEIWTIFLYQFTHNNRNNSIVISSETIIFPSIQINLKNWGKVATRSISFFQDQRGKEKQKVCLNYEACFDFDYYTTELVINCCFTMLAHQVNQNMSHYLSILRHISLEAFHMFLTLGRGRYFDLNFHLYRLPSKSCLIIKLFSLLPFIELTMREGEQRKKRGGGEREREEKQSRRKNISLGPSHNPRYLECHPLQSFQTQKTCLETTGDKCIILLKVKYFLLVQACKNQQFNHKPKQFARPVHTGQQHCDLQIYE